jgi:hypothetical protein
MKKMYIGLMALVVLGLLMVGGCKNKTPLTESEFKQVCGNTGGEVVVDNQIGCLCPEHGGYLESTTYYAIVQSIPRWKGCP